MAPLLALPLFTRALLQSGRGSRANACVGSSSDRSSLASRRQRAYFYSAPNNLGGISNGGDFADSCRARNIVDLRAFPYRQRPDSIGRARDRVAGECRANVVSERCSRLAARLGDATIFLGHCIAAFRMDIFVAGT